MTAIEEVKSGTTALQKLKDCEYSLIFADQDLPDVRGVDLLQVIRRSPKYEEVPFILVAASADKKDFINAVELGVTDYILKPFSFDTLQKRIKAALKDKKDGFVRWSDELSVGIAEFDTQHNKLIILINKLHYAFKVGQGREILGWVVSELINYTQTHFAAEESLMRKHEYPQYETHQKEHEKLISQIQVLEQKVKSKQVGVTIETMQFLKTWLSDHILGHDKRYMAFFAP